MPYDIIIGRDEADKAKYGTRGAVFLGKQYVKMGPVTSLSNNIYLDLNRSHVVFVVGKRGCLTEDTKVFTNHGYKGIKDFDPLKDKVYSYGENGFEWETAELLKYDLDKEDLIRIETYDGQMITMTEEHPLLVLEQGKKIWKEAKNFKIGDFLVTAAQIIEVKNDKQISSMDISGSRITKISRIKDVKVVYDLHVPKNHSFIANGIISHNSGKSYSMGVIAEGVADLPPEIKQNVAVVMLDTMGVYWTMKYPNKPDEEILNQWGLKAKPLDVKIFTPVGYYEAYKKKGIPTDYPFSIKPSELVGTDWCRTFNVDEFSAAGVLIQRVVNVLREKGKEFSMGDIISLVKTDKKSDVVVRDGVENLFSTADSWGLFSEKGTEIKDLVKGGQVAVLDMSVYATIPGTWGIKSLAVGLIAQKLFIERMIARKNEEFQNIKSAVHYYTEETKVKQEFPMVWMVLDEAHEFLPRDGKTAATDSLITILREGREPGISLILASQQPGKIHTDVLTQADTVIAHRVTARLDVEALGALMQSYMREGLDVQLNDLPRTKGSGVIFDDVNERLYPMSVRPRFTWHGGAAPSAIKEEKKKF